MSDPFVGEIRMFGGNFAPNGWEFCDGRLLPISEYETLFQLIGTTFGGDGQESFGLPNLQCRFPIHRGQVGGSGQNFTWGEMGGTEEETLTTQQIPAHTHALLASESPADQLTVGNNLPAEATKRFYLSPGTPAAMGAQAVGAAGGSQPHANLQPYLVVTFIISLFGIYPFQG